jgi:hypothetical protein
MQKQCLLMGFIWNIKQHKIGHKYSKAHYVLVDFKINKLKKGNTSKFPPILPCCIPTKTITSSQGFKHVNK